MLGIVVAMASSILASGLTFSLSCSTIGIRWLHIPMVDSTV